MNFSNIIVSKSLKLSEIWYRIFKNTLETLLKDVFCKKDIPNKNVFLEILRGNGYREILESKLLTLEQGKIILQSSFIILYGFPISFMRRMFSAVPLLFPSHIMKAWSQSCAI